jgi:hypothetical protein
MLPLECSQAIVDGRTDDGRRTFTDPKSSPWASSGELKSHTVDKLYYSSEEIQYNCIGGQNKCDKYSIYIYISMCCISAYLCTMLLLISCNSSLLVTVWSSNWTGISCIFIIWIYMYGDTLTPCFNRAVKNKNNENTI